MTPQELKKHIDVQTYDKYYQDVDVIGFQGYTKTSESWKNLKDLFIWKDKVVLELGCFHGYFCVKTTKLGSTAIGLDKSASIIETAKLIADLSGVKIDYRAWMAGDDLPTDIPDVDITLCLNALHHFGDKKDLALSKIKSKYAIFEIDLGNLNDVKKHFNVVKVNPSHRENRKIFLCENK